MSAPCSARVRLLLAGGLAAVLTACSSGGSPSGDGSPAAYDNQDVLTDMTDAVAHQDSVRLTLGTKQSPADIAIDTTWGDEPAFRALTGGDPAQQLEVRRVAGRVYLGGEMVGRQWTYLDLDDPRLSDPDSTFDAGPVTTLLDIDVLGDLEALVSATTAAEDDGTKDIEGVASDHYTLTVSSQAWFDGLAERSMYRAMDLPETIQMDLYVDGDSLPVQLSYEVPGKPEESALIDYTRWGTPVTVTAPRRAEHFS